MRIFVVFLLFFASLSANQVYATFEVEAKEHARLSLNTQGIISSVNVDIGSVVKKGDVLLELESSEQNALFRLAKIETDQAKRSLDRAKNIRDSLSIEEFEQIESSYHIAKANLEYREVILTNRKLKAPFDGVIADRFVHSGDLIERAVNGAFEIVSTSTKLIVSFDQSYFDKVQIGDKFHFTIDGKEGKYEAEIAQKYPSINSRKARAICYFDTNFIGSFGSGTIITK